MADKSNMTGFNTIAIHAGQYPDPTTGAVMTSMRCCVWSMLCNSTKSTAKSAQQVGAKVRQVWAHLPKALQSTSQHTLKNCKKTYYANLA